MAGVSVNILTVLAGCKEALIAKFKEAERGAGCNGDGNITREELEIIKNSSVFNSLGVADLADKKTMLDTIELALTGAEEEAAKGIKISGLSEEDQKIANDPKIDKDQNGYLDADEKLAFDREKIAGIFTEEHYKELTAKVRTINPFNPTTENSTKAADNQEMINEVLEILIEGNKRVPKIPVTNATSDVTTALSDAKYNKIIEVKDGKIIFKHSNIVVDISKIHDLDENFALKDITVVVNALEKAILNDKMKKHQARIDELDKSINGETVKDDNTNKNVHIPGAIDRFNSSIRVKDADFKSVNARLDELKKEGKDVEDLPKASQIVYYKHQFEQAIAGSDVFKLNTDQEYELNLDATAKEYYDKLNKLNPELDLKGKVTAILANMTEKHRKELELAGMNEMKEILEPIYNKLKPYKESMERGEKFLKDTRSADKDDVKKEKAKQKEVSKSTGKTNRKYSEYASGVKVKNQQSLNTPITTKEGELNARVAATSEHDMLVDKNKALENEYRHKDKKQK